MTTQTDPSGSAESLGVLRLTRLDDDRALVIPSPGAVPWDLAMSPVVDYGARDGAGLVTGYQVTLSFFAAQPLDWSEVLTDVRPYLAQLETFADNVPVRVEGWTAGGGMVTLHSVRGTTDLTADLVVDSQGVRLTVFRGVAAAVPRDGQAVFCSLGGTDEAPPVPEQPGAPLA